MNHSCPTKTNSVVNYGVSRGQADNVLLALILFNNNLALQDSLGVEICSLTHKKVCFYD